MIRRKRAVFGQTDCGDWLVAILRATFREASCVTAHYDGTNADTLPVTAWPLPPRHQEPVHLTVCVEGLAP